MSGLVLVLMFLGGFLGFRSSFGYHLKRMQTEVADVI